MKRWIDRVNEFLPDRMTPIRDGRDALVRASVTLWFVAVIAGITRVLFLLFQAGQASGVWK